MSDPTGTGEERRGRLADAVREVKNRAADRDDVVVELREASRTRLEMLAAELAPVFSDVPHDVDIFDFAISSGLQPRLWIDAVAHVDLGRDRRSFRFVRDTRAGRIVLAESHAMPPVVDAVTIYVAERLVERERALDGTLGTIAPKPAEVLPAAATDQPAPAATGDFGSALLILALGMLFGAGLAAALFWDKLVLALGLGR